MCTAHGALVQDKRVHGGATLGTLVHETAPHRLDSMKEMVFPQPIIADAVSGSGFKPFGSAVGAPRGLGAEGRVHGGRLIALLAAGGSGNPGSFSGNVNAMGQKWV